MTVTSDSSCNNPADSSVWSSSTNNPSTNTFTCRIWRSIGSSQCLFSMQHRLQFFNSACWLYLNGEDTTFQGLHFHFAWHGTHGVNCPTMRYVFKMWGALKSTASLLKCEVLYCKIHEFSMQIIRGTHDFFSKTYYIKRLDFLFARHHMTLSFLCFWPRIVSRPQNRNDHKQLSKHQSRHYSHLFLPTLGAKIYLLYQLVGTIFKLENAFPRASLASLLLDQPWSFPFRISSPFASERRLFSPRSLAFSASSWRFSVEVGVWVLEKSGENLWMQIPPSQLGATLTYN